MDYAEDAGFAGFPGVMKQFDRARKARPLRQRVRILDSLFALKER